MCTDHRLGFSLFSFFDVICTREICAPPSGKKNLKQKIGCGYIYILYIHTHTIYIQCVHPMYSMTGAIKQQHILTVQYDTALWYSAPRV